MMLIFRTIFRRLQQLCLTFPTCQWQLLFTLRLPSFAYWWCVIAAQKAAPKPSLNRQRLCCTDHTAPSHVYVIRTDWIHIYYLNTKILTLKPIFWHILTLKPNIFIHFDPKNQNSNLIPKILTKKLQKITKNYKIWP